MIRGGKRLILERGSGKQWVLVFSMELNQGSLVHSWLRGSKSFSRDACSISRLRVAFLGGLLLFAANGMGATFTVTSMGDSGAGTLRAALTSANGTANG